MKKKGREAEGGRGDKREEGCEKEEDRPKEGNEKVWKGYEKVQQEE